MYCDRDWAIQENLGVGSDFEYEIISKDDRIGRRFVAAVFTTAVFSFAATPRVWRTGGSTRGNRLGIVCAQCAPVLLGGLNFSYYYNRSSLIDYDGTPAPAYTMDTFEQSTVPVCRMPHLWLDDGNSLYDVLGQDYTQLCFDLSANTTALEGLRRAIKVLAAQARDQDVYRHTFVLSRPDRHVAWRGNALPFDVWRLIDRIRGALVNKRTAAA